MEYFELEYMVNKETKLEVDAYCVRRRRTLLCGLPVQNIAVVKWMDPPDIRQLAQDCPFFRHFVMRIV